MVLLISLVHSAHSAVLAEANTKFFDNLQILFLQFKTKEFFLGLFFYAFESLVKGSSKGSIKRSQKGLVAESIAYFALLWSPLRSL